MFSFSLSLLFLIPTIAAAETLKRSAEEWVLTVPAAEEKMVESSFPTATILKKNVVGAETIYVIREKDTVISHALKSNEVKYGTLTKNYMITMGPGDPAYADFNRKENIRHDGKRKKKREIENYTTVISDGSGSFVMANVASRCRTEPVTSNVGFEVGYFSWGIDRIDQRSLPLNRQACLYGSSSVSVPGAMIVDVYVLDTGVENDPSFFRPVSYDYSYYDDGNGGIHSSDCNGHATHVAGLVASETYGVSPYNVKIHSIKVLDCQGNGDFASLISGLSWVRQNRNPYRRSIINMSLGSSGGYSTPIATIITNLWNEGTFVVASLGNNGNSDCSVFPGNLDVVIGVGATNQRDERASFSNYGSCLDSFAPGVSIVSCSNVPGQGGRILSGTSMSAPIFVGALSNWLYAHDDANHTQPSFVLKESFFSDLTRDRVESSTLDDCTANVLAYVGGASEGSPSPPPPFFGGGERTNRVPSLVFSIFLFVAFASR